MMRLILSKLQPYLLGALILSTLALPYIGVKIYDYWSDFIPDKDGYNSISATIAYVGGILNLITIIFLYLNYGEQKRQNNNQQVDIEFNRAIDLTYKQLEYTTKLKEQFLLGESKTVYINIVLNSVKSTSFAHGSLSYLKSQFNNVTEILSLYKDELGIYNSILIGLKDQNKRAKLSQIVFRNISVHFSENIVFLKQEYKSFDFAEDKEHQKLYDLLTALVDFYNQ